EQATLGVDVLLPDFDRQQRRLAVGRERPGERHAEADLDRLPPPGAARRLGQYRRSRRDEDRGKPGERRKTASSKHEDFLPCGDFCRCFMPQTGHARQGGLAQWLLGPAGYLVASPPSTMMVSTSPAPLR